MRRKYCNRRGNYYKYVCLTDSELLQHEMYEDRGFAEFKNEILALSRIEHLNLVRLLGYIEHGDEMILVVEYVGNGTLREHLDGKSSNMNIKNIYN